MNTTLDWSKVSKFNFTWAIPGGAWLEWLPVQSSAGLRAYQNWFSFSEIQKHLGQVWIDRQLQRQGWMTGCWIDVSPAPESCR